MIKTYNRFGFGKYEGMRVDRVAQIDPSYIWYCENQLGYRFTPEVKRIARMSADYKYNQPRYGGSFY